MAKIIRTDEDYHQALERLSALVDAELGSTEGFELELLAVMIEQYEEEHYPLTILDERDCVKR